MPIGQVVQKKTPRLDIVPGGQGAQRLPLSYVPGRHTRVSVGGTQRRGLRAAIKGRGLKNSRGRRTSVMAEEGFMLNLFCVWVLIE